MLPKVTIIMPSLNVADYIEECIKSAVFQTLKEIEILCIDAGSTDGTLEILQKYADMDRRIRLINSDRRSYGYQVNLGIRQAQGEYVAILETDDYIAESMYESLYDKAHQYNLDYIKGDYIRVEQIYDEVYFSPISIFHSEERELYDKIISTQSMPQLYWRDIHIWKGLYKKEFLIRNEIFLNESVGAAYQDYGFGLLLHTKAVRGMFVPQTYYYYRWGRAGASSGNKNILKYSYQEFKRVFDEELINPTKQQLNQIYYRIAIDFPSEYSRVLKMVGYDIESDYLSPFYGWFKNLLEGALSIGSLTKENGSVQFWNSLQLLMEQPEKYADSIKAADECRQFRIAELNACGAVIFGAGKRGMQAYKHLRGDGIKINAVVDNAFQKQGNLMGKYTIISLEQCVRENKDSFYIIANLKHKQDIREQMLGCGISESKIKNYEELC